MFFLIHRIFSASKQKHKKTVITLFNITYSLILLVDIKKGALLYEN